MYMWGAIYALIIVFAGFARSYYLKAAFGTPELPLLVHVHGLVMTSWFVLVLVQVTLVARNRTYLHRRLGVAGAFLAIALVVVGVMTAIAAARLGHAPPGPPPLNFLAVPIGDMAVFSVLVGSALWFRRRSDIHKRLMLLSCVGILTAAIARMPLPLFTNNIVEYFSLTILGILAFVAYDTIRNRRLHPALALGALLIIISWPLRLALSGTAAWLQFATWLTQ